MEGFADGYSAGVQVDLGPKMEAPAINSSAQGEGDRGSDPYDRYAPENGKGQSVSHSPSYGS